MLMENAIKTAIEYETRIMNIYRKAADSVQDPAGKKVLQMLGDDEQSHIDYLESRLDMWKKSGELKLSALKSLIPSGEILSRETSKLQNRMSVENKSSEKDILNKALRVEIETSEFYEKMVREMTGEAQEMFAQFLKIEENHIATVQAELDYINKSGFWFDFKEFDME